MSQRLILNRMRRKPKFVCSRTTATSKFGQHVCVPIICKRTRSVSSGGLNLALIRLSHRNGKLTMTRMQKLHIEERIRSRGASCETERNGGRIARPLRLASRESRWRLAGRR